MHCTNTTALRSVVYDVSFTTAPHVHSTLYKPFAHCLPRTAARTTHHCCSRLLLCTYYLPVTRAFFPRHLPPRRKGGLRTPMLREPHALLYDPPLLPVWRHTAARGPHALLFPRIHARVAFALIHAIFHPAAWCTVAPRVLRRFLPPGG